MLKTLNTDSLFNTSITVIKEVTLSDVLPLGMLVLILKDGTFVVYEEVLEEVIVNKYKDDTEYVLDYGQDLYPSKEEEITAENDWNNVYTIVTTVFEEAKNFNLDKIYFFPA